MEMLQVKNLSKSFGGTVAVQDFSFVTNTGAITGLIGPNGAGKTTVFNLICGCLTTDDGKIIFKGKEITDLPIYEINKCGIARTYQGIRIFPNLTVLENVLTARHRHNRSNFWNVLLRPLFARSQDMENRQRALAFLEIFNLTDLQNKLAGSLPFVHQSILSIANSYATEPDLLLLDEPLAGMNPAEKDLLVDIIQKIRDTGVSILIIEHNMKAIMSMCDHVIVLHNGEMLAEGKPSYIQEHSLVIEAYLGVSDDA